MLLEIKINLPMSPSILFLFIPIAYSMLNTELNTFSFGDLRRTGYPSVGTVSYPVPTRTQSDKMYPVHHFPPSPKSNVHLSMRASPPQLLLKLMIIALSWRSSN